MIREAWVTTVVVTLLGPWGALGSHEARASDRKALVPARQAYEVTRAPLRGARELVEQARRRVKRRASHHRLGVRGRFLLFWFGPSVEAQLIRERTDRGAVTWNAALGVTGENDSFGFGSCALATYEYVPRSLQLPHVGTLRQNRDGFVFAAGPTLEITWGPTRSMEQTGNESHEARGEALEMGGKKKRPRERKSKMGGRKSRAWGFGVGLGSAIGWLDDERTLQTTRVISTLSVEGKLLAEAVRSQVLAEQLSQLLEAELDRGGQLESTEALHASATTALLAEAQHAKQVARKLLSGADGPLGKRILAFFPRWRARRASTQDAGHLPAADLLQRLDRRIESFLGREGTKSRGSDALEHSIRRPALTSLALAHLQAIGTADESHAPRDLHLPAEVEAVLSPEGPNTRALPQPTGLTGGARRRIVDWIGQQASGEAGRLIAHHQTPSAKSQALATLIHDGSGLRDGAVKEQLGTVVAKLQPIVDHYSRLSRTQRRSYDRTIGTLPDLIRGYKGAVEYFDQTGTASGQAEKDTLAALRRANDNADMLIEDLHLWHVVDVAATAASLW